MTPAPAPPPPRRRGAGHRVTRTEYFYHSIKTWRPGHSSPPTPAPTSRVTAPYNSLNLCVDDERIWVKLNFKDGVLTRYYINTAECVVTVLVLRDPCHSFPNQASRPGQYGDCDVNTLCHFCLVQVGSI